jgi:hypothetical protein
VSRASTEFRLPSGQFAEYFKTLLQNRTIKRLYERCQEACGEDDRPWEIDLADASTWFSFDWNRRTVSLGTRGLSESQLITNFIFSLLFTGTIANSDQFADGLGYGDSQAVSIYRDLLQDRANRSSVALEQHVRTLREDGFFRLNSDQTNFTLPDANALSNLAEQISNANKDYHDGAWSDLEEDE